MKPPPFVGRTEELRAIDARIRQGWSGSGHALFITGEGGLGKTRLVSEVAGKAEGWTVALGRAYPVESGVPFAVFADALLPVLRGLDSSALAVLTRGGGGELRRILPGLDAAARIQSTPADDPAEFKARMFWNFSQLLEKLGQRRPVLLILENLQWADPSSLELLHFAARHASRQKLLFLCTYNSSESDGNPVLITTERSLLEIGAASRIELTPLSTSEILEIVRKSAEMENAGLEKFSALLYEWTRGNPFFVEEILKELAESGKLRAAGASRGEWDMKLLALPSTVRATIESRLHRLSGGALKVASAAAVIGTRASLDILPGITSLEYPEIVRAIAELQSQRILVEVSDHGSPLYDFAHPLFRQVLSARIGSANSSLLHGKIAAALEQKYGASADAHAAELAYHYSRSCGAATGDRTIRYLEMAGHSALARYANREAATYFQAALDRVDSCSPGPDMPSPDTAIAGLARALQRNGDYAAAIHLWMRARDRAAESGDSRKIASAEHRIGLAEYWSANSPAALRHFTAALAYAEKEEDDALIVRIYLARAIVLQDLGEVEKARAGVEDALIVAERSGDVVLLARVHRALLLLYTWTGPRDRARQHGAHAVRYSEASGNTMLEWTAHWAMALLSGLSADAAGVVSHLAAAESLNEQLQSPVLAIWTAEISVQYLSGTGDWEAALVKGTRAIESARLFGQRGILPRLLVWTGLIHIWRGNLENARLQMEEAWKLSRAGSPRSEGDIPVVVPAYYGLASLHLHTRNYNEAITAGEAGLKIADRAGYSAWALQWLLPVIGEAALWARQWKTAERYSHRMRKDARRLDHPLGVAWADACDGLLVVHRDSNPAGGIRLLADAAGRMEELQVFSSAAVIRRHLGRALMDCGNREGARRELKRAHDMLLKLGARSELAVVRDQLRALGTRPPAKVVATGAAGLTARELEIARLVAKRKSSRQIGDALHISPRTVSTHLSNTFAKLGVDSRGALADFVREKGLSDPV